MPYETIVGRTKEDLEKFENKAIGYIGKHIVGTGEEAHLTTKVFLDLMRPHIILISGKRGTGKSYSAGVIAEEIALLPTEHKKNLAVVMIDTMGIYWSMKYPNEQQLKVLQEWKLEPKDFQNVKIYVPYSQLNEFQKNEIPVDGGITIAPYEFSAEEWRLAFNLSATDPIGVSLEKNVNELKEKEEKFTIDDIISKIRDDEESSKEIKNTLENMLTVAKQWGVFGTKGVSIEEIVKPSQITIVDISHLRAVEAWSVRNFIVALIAREIYQKRVLARKEEEMTKITGEEKETTFPLTWLIIDEAHNFIPSDFDTISSAPLKTIAKQGREPGVSLVVITQMPNKLHQDILSQTDIVISHRLTSKADLEALHTVSQTYMSQDLWKYINSLPRLAGSVIILDDNLEKIFTAHIRPRYSHHGGGTAGIL